MEGCSSLCPATNCSGRDHSSRMNLNLEAFSLPSLTAANPFAVADAYGVGTGGSTLYFRSGVRSAAGSTSTTTLESPTTSPSESKL